MLTLTLQLLLVHLIGDFLLQPNKWEKNKRTGKIKSPYLYAHVCVHGFLLLLVFQFDAHYLSAIGITIASHFIIDLAKLYSYSQVNEKLLFFTDQFGHLLVILGVVSIYHPLKLNSEYFLTPNNLVLVLALILLTSVTSICLKILLSEWKPKEKKTLKMAGTYIGMLERLFIFGFVVIDFWDGIGFLLAAKSVFRFGDLSNANDRNLTEYVLIGTLLSFGIAILVSEGYLRVLSQID